MGKSSTFNLQDGGLYYGDLNSKGLPDSLDSIGMWDDGRRYIGQWVNGRVHGVGTMYYPDGSVVRGFWYNNELLHTFGNQPPVSQLPKNQNKIAALLVGNDYKYTDHPLKNCVSDVNALGRKLRYIGADVTIVENASRTGILRAINEFCGKDSSYDHALFYFSGHGNMIDTIHCITSDNDELIGLETNVLGELAKTRFKNKILISDACNTFIPISANDRDIICIDQNDLHSNNVCFAFSTANGHSATAFSHHHHSPYALALLEYIDQANLNIVRMFSEVSRFVVDYSIRQFGGVIEVPHADFTTIDPDFCLYVPQ